MVLRDISQLLDVAVRGIRAECLVAADTEKIDERAAAVFGFEHHDFVIAAQRDKLACGIPRNEPFQHRGRLRPAVDVVAEGEDHIRRQNRHGGFERLQRVVTAVDIADGKETHEG